MRKRAGLGLLLIAALAAGPAPAAYDWSEVAAILAGAVPSIVPALVFAVVRGDEVLHTRAIGWPPGQVVFIASASKMPSSALVLTLADDGLLDLDAPVGAILAGAIVWPADKAAVTTRMLLNHTHGLDETPCLDDRFTTLAECVQEIADAPLLFPPGSGFFYGGAGFQVAGLVAQELSGQSWAQLVATRLAAPLGLTTFTYGASANPLIGGGARSNAADYARLLSFQLGAGEFGGVRVLSSDAVAVMRTNQVAGVPVVSTPMPWAAGYSFGWWFAPAFLLGLSQGPELSDPGKFGTTPWIDLDLGYGAVLLLATETLDGIQIQNAVREAVQRQILAQPGPGAVTHRDGFESGSLAGWSATS